MSSFKTEDYTPTIDAILRVSDLEKITVKKIRKALEGLFGIEFDKNKKEINDLILNRFYNMNDLKKNENDKIKSLQDKIDELVKENKKMSVKLNTKLTNYQIKNDISNSTSNKKRKTSSKSKDNSNSNNNSDEVKEKKKATGGFSKEYRVSPELANFLGNNNDISRPELVKKLWDYIKLNNLQNPQDKREILSDEKLFPLFGEKVHMFTMNKVLSKHLFNRDEIVNGYDDIKPDVGNQQPPQLPPHSPPQQQIPTQQYQQNMNSTYNSNNFNGNTDYDPNYNGNFNGDPSTSYNNYNNNNGYQDFNGIP
ncbi:hypothetical protein BVG19_g1016 [[Candida] boidinii]|nr:hypothetical protein BVG19_g1016 [[Candida] boidinii]OWB50625.1 hypothetical protein B5S27_g2177 [[Candida] boidinii]